MLSLLSSWPQWGHQGPSLVKREVPSPVSSFFPYLPTDEGDFFLASVEVTLNSCVIQRSGIRGQPVGRRPYYWSQHPESQICADVFLSHWPPNFSAKVTIHSSCSQAGDSSFIPRKGSRKSELESPLVLKAQCQGIKTNKYISKRKAHPATTWRNSSGAWETFG